MYHVILLDGGFSALAYTPRHNTVASHRYTRKKAQTVADNTNAHFGAVVCVVEYRA